MTFEEILKEQLGLAGYQTTQPRGPAAAATRKYYNYHQGTDIGTPAGTAIRPKFSGVYLGTINDQTGYGTRAAIYDPAKDQTYYLSHLAQVMNMKPGQTFQPGTTIAYTGGVPGTPGAGNTTGAHLDIVTNSGKQSPQYSYAANLSSAKSGSWRGMNPMDLLRKVQSTYGKNVKAVGTNKAGLEELSKKYKNSRVVKVTI